MQQSYMKWLMIEQNIVVVDWEKIHADCKECIWK